MQNLWYSRFQYKRKAESIVFNISVNFSSLSTVTKLEGVRVGCFDTNIYQTPETMSTGKYESVLWQVLYSIAVTSLSLSPPPRYVLLQSQYQGVESFDILFPQLIYIPVCRFFLFCLWLYLRLSDIIFL